MKNKYSKNRKISLWAEAGTLVEDDIYFFSSEYNLLYKIHIPDFTISIISHIPCDKVFAVAWFRRMRYWKGKLLLIPSYAEKIWIYDLNSGKWDSIAIDYPQIYLKFWGTIIYKDNAFLFGVLYPAILKVNLNNHSVSYLEIEYWPEGKKEGLFLTDAIRVDHMVFCPTSISNKVLRFDLETLEYDWKQIGDSENKYTGIDRGKNCFWISAGECGKNIKWNGDSEWEEFSVPKIISNRSYQFIGVICDEDKIRFLTQQDGESLEITDDGQILLTEKTKSYVHVEHYANGTIVLMQSDAHLDIKWMGKWIKGICEVSYDEFKAYFEKSLMWNYAFLESNKEIREEKIFKTRDYIELTIKQQNTDDFFMRNDIGTDIWKTIS